MLSVYPTPRCQYTHAGLVQEYQVYRYNNNSRNFSIDKESDKPRGHNLRSTQQHIYAMYASEVKGDLQTCSYVVLQLQ